MIKQFRGTGRRKTSVAAVRLVPGTGKITINNRELTNYFPLDFQRRTVLLPLEATNSVTTFDIIVKVSGGGITGQVDSIQLGIARALIEYDAELKPILRGKELLTRDPRMVERKKYGKKKARKSFQFSKR